MLTKLYEVYKGYKTYLVRQTRITEEMELQRMSLPESSKKIVLIGSENKLIILDISQEKGAGFLFPAADTLKEYRERFLKGVLVDFVSTRLYPQQNNIDEDEVKDLSSFDWFTFISKVIVEEEEKGEGVDLVGGMDLS